MTTAAAGHPLEKKDEKVEKRRALGRGLESLLPGPRVVVRPEPRVPSPEHAAPASPGQKSDISSAVAGTAEAVPFPVSTSPTTIPDQIDAERAGVPAPQEHTQAQANPANLVANLEISLIDKNPYQTRVAFDEETLIELRDSIKEHGVVQPIVVRPAEQGGRFILVLGERRLRASKMAGKEAIPALVRRLSPQQAAEMTVLENVIREDLNPVEQAEAFRVLSQQFKLTQEEIAERIGVSRETVANYMRLLRLPEKVMQYMLEDRLSFSDARELLRLESMTHMLELAEEIVAHRLKWDEIEERVNQLNEPFHTMPGAKKKSGGARWVDPNVRAAQTDMERTLGMRVRIRDRNGKGKIVIEYASVDDYDRVVEMLRGKSR
jgi:ParB family chromosome partitioning protein